MAPDFFDCHNGTTSGRKVYPTWKNHICHLKSQNEKSYINLRKCCPLNSYINIAMHPKRPQKKNWLFFVQAKKINNISQKTHGLSVFPNLSGVCFSPVSIHEVFSPIAWLVPASSAWNGIAFPNLGRSPSRGVCRSKFFCESKVWWYRCHGPWDVIEYDS